MSRVIRFVVLAAVLGGSLLMPNVALAHEQRDVGPYQFTVGFMNEPAIEGEQNGIWLKIVDAATGTPVEDAASTLQATLIKGAATRQIELRPAFGEQGVYTAIFYPTEAGDYTFHFSGEIAGTPIDETFTSSPDGFHGVEATADLQFPTTLPAASDLSTQLAAAQATARTATILGAAGLGVGLLALLLAGMIALRRRRPAPATHGSTVPH
jgi:hypothetical protein